MRKPKDIIINNKTLAEILVEHEHWIFQDCEGWEEMRADLRGADLSRSNLNGVYLKYALLDGADLRSAELNGADLYRADLVGADLRGAELNGANLVGADLSGSYLSLVNLSGARLYDADLSGVELINANLRGADLRYANLNFVNLSGAELNGAEFSNANLHWAKEIPNISLNCPSDGAFIGWKKVSNYIIKLEIPEDAKRSSGSSKKCRCSKAKVLGIFTLDGEVAPIDRIVNYKYTETEYIVGEMVYPDGFDENRFRECSNGIHFFINKRDAIEY